MIWGARPRNLPRVEPGLCHTAYLCKRLLAKVRLTVNVAKVQYKLGLAFCLNLPWYGSMEWNMEENFSME